MATPDRVVLRSPRSDKKPVKILSDDSNVSPSETSESEGLIIPCHCTKTHCLKLYCSCFHNNRLCGPNCICKECHNDLVHVDERKDAVEFVRKRGVRAHEIDKFDTT